MPILTGLASTLASYPHLFRPCFLSESPQYSDGTYIATIIACLGYALIVAASSNFSGKARVTPIYPNERQESNELVRQSVQEVTRYMKMDRLVPSYHNVVTIAGLEVRTLACMHNKDRFGSRTVWLIKALYLAVALAFNVPSLIVEDQDYPCKPRSE